MDISTQSKIPRASVSKRLSQYVLRFLRRNIFIVVPFVILLAALGYYYYQYRHILAQNTPAAQSKEQVQKAVADIEKLIYIKDNSDAQLAVITDITKLAGQKFFENAKNGDELVLFPSSQRAVLYRPSIGKIIEVGPFTPQTTPVAGTSAPASLYKPASTSASTSTKTR